MTERLDRSIDTAARPADPPVAVTFAPAAVRGASSEAAPTAVEAAPKVGEVLPPQAWDLPSYGASSLEVFLKRSVFRDIPSQVDAEAIFAKLRGEFGCRTFTQEFHLKHLANDIVELQNLHVSRSAAILNRKVQAAREILSPGFSHFYPPKPGARETNGMVATAYGTFMEHRGNNLVYRDDAELIAEAEKALAAQGRPKEDLLAEAMRLALPEIMVLDRAIAMKEQAILAKEAHLIALGDRLREKKPAQTKDSFNGQ